MTSTKELAIGVHSPTIPALKSKLTVYSIGLQKAKKRGDWLEARKWADAMANIRKEIIALSGQRKK